MCLAIWGVSRVARFNARRTSQMAAMAAQIRRQGLIDSCQSFIATKIRLKNGLG